MLLWTLADFPGLGCHLAYPARPFTSLFQDWAELDRLSTHIMLITKQYGRYQVKSKEKHEHTHTHAQGNKMVGKESEKKEREGSVPCWFSGKYPYCVTEVTIFMKMWWCLRVAWKNGNCILAHPRAFPHSCNAYVFTKTSTNRQALQIINTIRYINFSLVTYFCCLFICFFVCFTLPI